MQATASSGAKAPAANLRRASSRIQSGTSQALANLVIEDDLLCRQQQMLRMGQMVDESDYFAEMEEKLFGSKPKAKDELCVSDKDFVPLRTGVEGYKLLKHGPKHILDADAFEPLYIHQENILEDCLNREAERVAFQHNLMNRVVYDSVNECKIAPKAAEESKDGHDQQTQDRQGAGANDQTPDQASSNPLNLPTPTNCDNCAQFDDYYQPSGKNDYTLCFESRFESGNLRRAIQVYEFEYDLILKPDHLTKGNNQWFYFRLSNTRKGRTYRFNIINLLKPDSLYNHGMQPLMYSEAEA